MTSPATTTPQTPVQQNALPEASRKVTSTISSSSILNEYHERATAHVIIVAGSIGLILFFIWAALTPIHELAVGTGEILPNGFVQEVQHLEGGIVAEVLVQEGQVVEQGQPLVRIDDLTVRAELSKAQSRTVSIRHEIARQRAATDIFSGVFTGVLQLRGGIDSQQAATQADDEYRQAQLDVIRAGITAVEADLASISAQKSISLVEMVLLEQRLQDYETALRSGAISRQERDAVVREKLRLEANLAQLDGQSAAAAASLVEFDARHDEMMAGFRQTAQSAITELEVQLSEAQETIAQLSDRLARTTIVAPHAGTVHELKVRNPGQVVAPGSLVASVVPDNQGLFAEVEIPTNEIGFVSTGMRANIKVLTYDATRFGGLEGTVIDVSPFSLRRPNSDASYYRVRLALDSTYIGNPDADRQIAPGMSVTADLLLGEKTVLTYLLKPFRAISDRAFSEQ